MATLKCKMCGGDLVLLPDSTVCECEHCGSRQTVPSADNEKKITLFTRAGRLLRNCEFDKASGVFETIVGDFPEEAEAYWGLVLCKYGIEYVDDPATGKKIPTCHRSSFDSVLDEPNFEQACENTDAVARRVYRDEARQIEQLRQAILEISGKEEPYDVFISYKEKDENGERTQDSVIAQDIYKELTDEGYRVFFSRISLESKLGTEYEPYIFAALNSARVMIVVGTDYENFDAVWVKNEWSRFLKLIASGEKKTLIPVFKNMDAYDMPKEFSKFAAQDMGKVGAMQDLLHGVEKLIGKKGTNSPAEQAPVAVDSGISAMNAQTAAMLKRGYMMLSDGDYAKADDFFERVLNNDAECAKAYWGKTLAAARAFDAKAYGETLFQKLKEGESQNSKIITVKEFPLASLARKADDTGLLKDFSDQELEELFSDLESHAIQVQTAEEYYRKQESIYKDTASLHRLAESSDFDRAVKYADDTVREAESTGLHALQAKIAEAIEEEKKKETAVRAEAEQKENQIIDSVRMRLSGVKQEQERNRVTLEAARKEAEEEAEKNYQLALTKYEQDYKDAVAEQERFYQSELEKWQQKKADFEQNHDTAQENRRKLEQEISQQQRELLNLSGLFTGRRRRELEGNLALLRDKLEKTVVPKNPGPMPEKPSKLPKGTAPKREHFQAVVSSRMVNDFRDSVKCGISLAYRRAQIEKMKNTRAGEEIKFGCYPTSEDERKKPVEWLVLSNEGKRLLVISKYGIDCRPYHHELVAITWESCDLRKWLNSDFLKTAFSAEEQKMIPTVTVSAEKNPDSNTEPGNATQDKVFLLSIQEAKKYFSSDTERQCKSTEYAETQGCEVDWDDGNNNCCWWLRSPGNNSLFTAEVINNGYINTVGSYVGYSSSAVRPALWINLES